MKRLSILGSTGSIGTQALDVCRAHNIPVVALAAKSNIALLEKQIREFKPSVAAVYDEKAAAQLAFNVKDLSVKVLSGIDGLCEAASVKDAEMTLVAVSGMIGLKPTLEAVNAGKTIALANKETLVAGGELVMRSARENGVDILPVDSEHNALFQCLLATKNRKSEVTRLILTASGGPFYGRDKAFLEKVKKEDALKHPNWDMGAKVTIDSATMMNKGLEVIEAMWLFDLPLDKIDVVVHRQSIVHSMVEFCDGAVLAELATPDMRLPIQYALTYPERKRGQISRLNLCDMGTLSFQKTDDECFPCLEYCRKAAQIGDTMPAAVCAAGEEAVRLFIDDKIGFTDINYIVQKTLETHKPKQILCLEDILQADKEARECVSSFMR